MSDLAGPESQIVQIRGLAMRKLAQFGKSGSQVRVCYRFDDDFLVGLRFEAGLIRFQWNSSESWATVTRGEVVLETVSLAEDSVRRAA